MVAEDVDPDWPPPAYDPSDDLDTTPPSTGRAVWLVAALIAVVVIAAVATYVAKHADAPQRAAHSPQQTTAPAPTSAAGSAPTGPCGPDQAAALAAALAKVPPDRKTGKRWDPKALSGNYDPCAELSGVVVTVRDATRSAPDLALLFHRGDFVGTATPNAYSFTELEAPASNGKTVVLTYRTGQSCDSCPDGTLTTVGYQWRDDKVQMLDTPPVSLDSPP
ncbi:LppP/LprE family lipoprotein [Mycobacterium asiaticum]|uniref:LppP/LprE family lipoprotein n=1 Tax=Mycobacterium asiaticum TaxID=1790 RepID=A0A1A3MWU4_MYCAS|nr:LppP/LprE family lipoprotein [Mycobacterium asiaticum]OBK14001.1 hypothetical protein A5635_10735 [Mycobacterium asiaticum]